MTIVETEKQVSTSVVSDVIVCIWCNSRHSHCSFFEFNFDEFPKASLQSISEAHSTMRMNSKELHDREYEELTWICG
jgi:hypothetical protein